MQSSMQHSLKRRRYEPLTFTKPPRSGIYSSARRIIIGKRKAIRVVNNKKDGAFLFLERIKILVSVLLLISAIYSYWLHDLVGRVHEKPNSNVSIGAGAPLVPSSFSSETQFTVAARTTSQEDSDLTEERVMSKQLNVSSDTHHDSLVKKQQQQQLLLQTLLEQLGTEKGNSLLEDDSVVVVDAYSLFRDMLSINGTLQNGNSTRTNSTFDFVSSAKDALNDFADLYGGERVARVLLKKGILRLVKPFDSLQALQYTAQRMHRSREHKRPFVMGFAGYSVTAGRGNYHNQSFPFVMEHILRNPMKQLGIDLKVINGGMGGVPSLPYGLCLKNFFGEHQHVDVVGWDFAMNEANDRVGGLECFIRHVHDYNHQHGEGTIPPMLLIKDTHMAVNRTSMVQSYVEKDVFRDQVIIHSDFVARPFLDVKEKLRPVGFQKWREFGSPPRAPGRSKHHPAKREHEFIGWLIAMHFLAALEILAAVDLGLHHFQPFSDMTSSALPPPISTTVDATMHSIMYGVATEENVTIPSWEMRPVQCKTTFDPMVAGPLKDIIVRSSSNNNIQESLDIMLPKSLMFYNAGWVLDIGESERKAKQQLLRYGGLGFVDSKKAYRGVHASGPIQFFLSLPNNDADALTTTNTTLEQQHSVILCEPNEQNDSSSCDLSKDVSYTIGGVLVEDVKAITESGFTYLGKSICVHFLVPRKAVKSQMGTSNTDGFLLEISVTNPVVRKQSQACGISHAIWV